jgi:hypothetical protein
MSWAEANLLRVLQARAEARALLARMRIEAIRGSGDDSALTRRLVALELEQAIEPLWQDALAKGIDEETATAIIFKAFEGIIAPA